MLTCTLQFDPTSTPKREKRRMPVRRLTLQKSSFIDGGTWDEDTEQLVLSIHGKPYIFDHVPEVVVTGLEASGSPGRYFHDNLKGQYG